MDFSYLRLLIISVFSLARLAGQGGPSVEARLESSMVVVGEETYLTLWTEGVTIIDWPDSPPDMAPLALKRDDKRRFQINNYIRDGFRYRLSAFEPGVYEIPPFVFRTSSGLIKSEPLVLRAHPVEDLSTQGIKIAGAVTPYLTAIFLEKETPFVGEMQEVEAKLYLSQAPPNRLKLADGKVIKMQKDGLAAWRLTTRPEPSGFLDYDGQRFQAYTYRSSLNALREGSLTFGPGEAEAVFFQRASSFIHPLQFPAASLEARALPNGVPPGFEGAVGEFTMSVTPLARELKAGDTVTVESAITGTGNLEQFPGPRPVDPEDNWKAFEMIAKTKGGERRSQSGTVEFSQVLRPKAPVAHLPSYRFVYFDPQAASYATLTSPEIPLTLKGSLSPDGPGKETLPFLTPGSAPLRAFSKEPMLPLWSWQLIPAAFALFLLGREGRRRWLGYQISRQPAAEFERDLEALDDHLDDRARFYREAAHLATRWRGGEEFSEIHATRDTLCFRPDHPSEPVSTEEKNHMRQLLRTLAPVLVIALTFLAPLARAASLPADPARAKEEILASMKQAPAREHFYNLALCEQALGNPGPAALWAYRFELQGGDATDILADLPGRQREKREWLDWITLLSKDLYLQIGLGGLWGFLLLFLVAKFFRGKHQRLLVEGLTLTSVLALLVAGVSWSLYPREISFEPLENLSVVTEAGSLRSQPFEGGPAMLDSLEGSIGKAGVNRAGWTYLTLPGGLSGWIEEEKLTPIGE